jgi:hypothetical protein
MVILKYATGVCHVSLLDLPNLATKELVGGHRGLLSHFLNRFYPQYWDFILDRLPWS